MAAMITTEDNPYDPRTQFDLWYSWDLAQGYNTCSYLARILVLPEDFPDEINERLTELAIDEIIAIHAGGLYRKVTYDAA